MSLNSLYDGDRVFHRLYGRCEGAIVLFLFVFICLHRPAGLKFEFAIFFESFLQMVGDLWQRTDEVNGCFKNITVLRVWLH